MSFAPATKSNVKLRLALTGPSGSGKTYTALTVATTLGKTAVIDTEHHSSERYADLFTFDVAPLAAPFHPDRYIELMVQAYEAGYEVLVIDSLSHAWAGPGGILELVDQETRASRSGNSFQAWGKTGTPLHNRLVSKLLAFPGHLVCTMRSKTEWVVDEQGGKKVPRKIGTAPVQRDGIDFEFDLVAEMTTDHLLSVSKSRFVELADMVFDRPGPEFAELIAAQVKPEPRDLDLDTANASEVAG